MFHIKLIKYLYIGLTILAVICPVKISFMIFLPGLLLMWLFYWIYSAGLIEKGIDHTPQNNTLFNESGNFLTLSVVVAHLLFYPFYIKFYTGLNVFTSLSNLASGVSNYYIYQTYFNESELNVFSFTKLPYIIGHGLLRFMFIVIVFRTIIYKTHSSLIEKLSITIMAVVIAIIGFARGTSFEFFELFLIFFYSLVSKRVLSGQRQLIPKKLLVKISITIFGFIIFFLYNIKLRLGDNFNNYISTDFDTDSLLYSISKPVALLFFSLYDYFLFGIYFNSIAIMKLWFSSLTGFISIFIPSGISFLGIDINYRHLVSQFIVLGAKWTSDSITLIESYGIIITFTLIYFLGRFSRKICIEINKNLPASILLFYSCYLMLSMPIGNFITGSSANLISITAAFIFFKSNFLKRLLIK